MTPQPLTTVSNYGLGLTFIGIVAIIWTASSVLVQHLYRNNSFDSPFLLTYIGVSLFTLWLPWQWVWKKKNRLSVGGTDDEVEYLTVSTNDEDGDGASDDGVDGSHQEEEEEEERNQQRWTDQQHRKTALYIAPVWFLANLSYNASLEYTSITSSTVLASTGSLFTYIFAVCFRDESFGWTKLAGVLLGMLGSIITTMSDRETRRILMDHDSDEDGKNDWAQAMFGDLLGLVSAVGYGAYAVQTRLLCPHNEELYSMQLLLGYIGLLNMIALSPIAIFVLWTNHNAENALTGLVFGLLVIKGLFDNVLSDYLWLRAVILTNATVATVGLGLTIPLAFACDVISGQSVISGASIAGALSVLLGFVLVNSETQLTDDTRTSIIIETTVPTSQYEDAVVNVVR